jgi:Ca2+-binding RTX toxin-like protein
VLGGEGIDLVYSDTLDLFATHYTDVESLGLYGTADLMISATSAAGAMTLSGNAGSNAIFGANYDDTLLGNAGNDMLIGGWGFDNMVGGDGDDNYDVDAGPDVVTEESHIGSGIDEVATDSFSLNSENFANVERLTLYGNADLNLNGYFAASGLTLTGNDGANGLWGGSGDDSLVGGAGADTLHDGNGDDTMAGGTVADAFVFADQYGYRDVITDFAVGTDKIDLRGTSIDSVYFAISPTNHLGMGISTGIVLLNDLGQTISLDYNGDGISDHIIDLGNSSLALSVLDILIVDIL